VHTIPSRDISIEDRKLHRERVIAAGVARAGQRGIILDSGEVALLDLAPEDVGASSWATPPTVAGVYTTWLSWTVPRKVLVIYKVLQLSINPTVTSLRFWRGSRMTTMGINELEACYSGLPIIKNLAKALMDPESKEVLDRLAGREDVKVSPDLGSPMEAYFSEPYILDPDSQFQIEVKSREDSSGDYLVLGGFVIGN